MSAVVAEDPGVVIERLELLRRMEIAKLSGRDVWHPFAHQLPPAPGSWYLWLLLAGRGAGKALDVETPLATPAGWTTMGEVETGDQLLDENGAPCTVTLTSPVMHDRPCYRVRFSDGHTVIADADHRWLVWTHAYRKSLARRVGGGDPRKPQCQPVEKPSILTTEEMLKRLRHGKRGDLNLAVPVAAPLALPEARLPIDPYVLGAWLGDGHLHRAAITTMEPEVVAGIEAAGFLLTPDKHQNAGLATTYAIRAADGSKKRSLHRALRKAGLLAVGKHIPPAYLRASKFQRVRLLQGLMDTDGHVAPNGACEFSVVDAALALGVKHLVETLGLKATLSVKSNHVYRVRFNPGFAAVTVQRKLERQRLDVRAQAQRHTHRMVVDIEAVPTRPVKCVAVDSPSHLFLAGPGLIPTHNTDACASYFDRYMRHHPAARGGIVAPTLGDAAEACVYGPSGLMAHNPSVRIASRAGGTYVKWPNGSEARLFGTHTMDDVNRLRAGGNRELYWGEEIAAWRYLQESWENMEFGLRIGRWPHIIGSTTPKTRPWLKRLIEAEGTVVARATTFDNPKLPASQLVRLKTKYEGTRIGRQELYGEYLEDVEGALWTFEVLTRTRRTFAEIPDMVRVVVAVDPSGGDEEGNDEQGIVVCGRGTDGHGYVLADRSCKLSPEGWASRAILAYQEFKADRIVGETNFGGDLVIQNIKAVARGMNVEVATKKISASRGKAARAEPISALYEQDRAHNVGTPEELEHLEYQQRMWTPDSGWSPDRMDAAVWGLTEVMLNDGGPVEMRTFRTKARIPTGEDRFGSGVGF